MLQLQQLSKRFNDKILFENINQALPTGEKIALIGQNGSGKTTLLNIICGIEDADSGKIVTAGDHQIGFLPQEPNPKPAETLLEEVLSGDEKTYQLRIQLEQLTKELKTDHSPEVLQKYEGTESLFRSSGGYSIESQAQQLLDGLGFSAKQGNKSPIQLSGGWRMRLELAKVLLANPDILILDEPTNHLDLPSLVWVEAWLTSFPGTLIFVSHDRPLLNRLATRTLHLQGGHLQLYVGGFDSFLEQKEARTQLEQAQKQKVQKRIEEHQRFVDRFGAKATKAKQAQSRLKMIGKLRQLEENIPEGIAETDLVINIPKAPPSGKQVLQAKKLAIGYSSSDSLVSDISFDIAKGQRIAVIGANGLGKSTLIKTLAGVLDQLEGEITWGHQVKVGYFAQEQQETLDYSKNLLENVLASSTEIGQLDARKLLGSFLFSGDDVFKNTQSLSGGEKNRLGMACLLSQKANCLLLDEPTNHLDMTSVAVLIAALQDSTSTIIFVSHDREFIDALCTHIMVILPDGRSRLFVGNIEDYQNAAAVSGFPNVLVSDIEVSSKEKQSAPKQKKGDDERFKELKTQRNSLVKRCSQLETNRIDLEKVIAELDQELISTAPADYSALQLINQKKQEASQALDENESTWLETAEKIEEVEAELEKTGRSY